MRDGIAIARKGRAAISFVTSKFTDQGHFVAKAGGMPDIPRVELTHPVAGSGTAAMDELAVSITKEIVQRLEDS
ncbi:MAG: hypothetical protein AAF384_14640 [Pseudomonadota bacterium]